MKKGHNWGVCRKCGKISIHPMKGKTKSLEYRRKLSLAKIGIKQTPESNEKRRKTLLEFNKKLSKEERSKKYGNFGDKNPMANPKNRKKYEESQTHPDLIKNVEKRC